MFTDGHIIGYSVTTETSKMVKEGRNPGVALEVIVVVNPAPVVSMKDISKQPHDLHEDTWQENCHAT
jgi:hypothetical protein